MAYNFSKLNEGLDKTKEWLKKELSGIRTGRATPALLDSVKVDSYGSKVAINQVASVTVEDARTIRVVPWQNGQIKEIEKAVSTSNLGVSASSDDKGVRIFFPELTSESRNILIKVVREKLEDARATIRGERDVVWSDIQEKERKGGMSEDDKFRYKEEMQKLVDDTNSVLLGMTEKKEKDITS